MIYEAYLKIAKARDGRNILYGVNLDINNGIAVDKGATSKRAAVLAAMPFGKRVTQTNREVKRKDIEYRYAVQKDDMETAQRLVDEAADAAGYLKRMRNRVQQKRNERKISSWIRPCSDRHA